MMARHLGVAFELPDFLSFHDGFRTYDCYCMWLDNREAVEHGGKLPYELTEAQIAAGRRFHQLYFDKTHLAWLATLPTKGSK